MNKIIFILIITLFSLVSIWAQQPGNLPAMYYGDTVRTGIPFSKDPHVIWFQGQYLMYYSVPGFTDKVDNQYGWGVAVAKSTDLIRWERVGEVNADPAATYESKGFAVPCALVVGDTVHLFYQTYENAATMPFVMPGQPTELHLPETKPTPFSNPVATGTVAVPSMPK
jgi:hypothetical protein